MPALLLSWVLLCIGSRLVRSWCRRILATRWSANLLISYLGRVLTFLLVRLLLHKSGRCLMLHCISKDEKTMRRNGLPRRPARLEWEGYRRMKHGMRVGDIKVEGPHDRLVDSNIIHRAPESTNNKQFHHHRRQPLLLQHHNTKATTHTKSITFGPSQRCPTSLSTSTPQANLSASPPPQFPNPAPTNL